MELIPRGVNVYPPEVASKREEIKNRVISVFKRWGFRQVITPLFEYYDEIFQELDRSLEGGAVKLVERETGRIIVLRPDFTPQIARIAATLMREEPRPLRLYYYGSVFRWLPSGVLRDKEIWQIGLELIGLDRPEACAELVAISKETLDSLGVRDYRISISSVGFIKEVLNPLEEKKRRYVASALSRKDPVELERLLSDEDLEPKRKELIFSLMDLVGGEEILSRVRSTFSTSEIEKHLEELESIIEVLKRYGLFENVMLDLSEVRGLFYHMGFFFEVFAEGVGNRLAVGGRYDELMKAYGSDEAAMGFAFDLDALYKAAEVSKSLPEEERIDFLVIDLSMVKDKGVEVARVLRNKGYSVARDIIKRNLDESLEYARRLRIRRAVVITEELKALGKLRVVDIEGNRDVIVDEERFLSFEKI